MSGYIAKDDLIELLSEMQGRCGTRAELRQNSKIWNQVKDMPTADVAPVIRCKDCKNKDECQWYYYSGREDGFCAWAVRKEE